MQDLKKQLNQDSDHYCTPMGGCGSYGAPLKITNARSGYTIFGKGTTSYRWKDVSQEAEIYSIPGKSRNRRILCSLGL